MITNIDTAHYMFLRFTMVTEDTLHTTPCFLTCTMITESGFLLTTPSFLISTRFWSLILCSLLYFRYEQSDWGWDDKQKREEMSEDAAWYLIARQTDTLQPVACVHFRFDLDEGEEVLYWYFNHF